MTEFNEYQSSLEELKLEELPQEIREQFFEFLESVPYIQSLVSKDRKHAKDLPRVDGRIQVDLLHPHIIENMDYFRPAALHFQKTGRFTDLRPNGNPNSEYMKWFNEEKRRCREGYVRESDGEWITGYNYFFWNYTPMLVADKVKEGSKKALRKVGIPSIWEGHYLLFHYIDQARENGKHAAMLSSRGRGKSYCGAGMLTRNILLGETSENYMKVVSYIIASDKSYLMGGDQTLDKFVFNLSFCAQNTQFPRLKLTDSYSKMEWRMGYKDLDTNSEKGTLNSVVGKTLADDLEKMRGSRGALYIIEEFGSFSGLITTYNVLLKSVEENGIAYGQIFAYGTSAEKESDFTAAQELIYNPKGYNIYDLENVYDKAGYGKKDFAFFFPGYMNLAGRYEKSGVSDVTGALLDILKRRYDVKYNSTKPETIIRTIAEVPITPQEAITRIGHSTFPVADLSERLSQLDNDPSSLSDVYIGELVQSGDGKITFRPTDDVPVRNYPVTGDKPRGALEIFRMPEKDSNGKVFAERYIAGHDPVDDDEAKDSVSLSSTFVLDLWTDTLVAEYTGRRLADDNFEMARKMCLFYNAKLLYENNKKGIFAYFSKMQSLYLLADTPEYLRDMDIIKGIGIGNTSKGVGATGPVNKYADSLIDAWFRQPYTKIVQDENGEQVEVSVMNLYRIKSRALLQEAIQHDGVRNVDRIRALGMVMLYRQEKVILTQGNLEMSGQGAYGDELADDPFFEENWDADKWGVKENNWED